MLTYPDSYYFASSHAPLKCEPLESEIDADVCVIGGGYTGLSSAIHLAKLGLSVVLLEAHQVGWGASGRNGGQVGSGHNKDQIQLEKQFGTTRAKELWQIAESAKAIVKSVIEEFSINCDYKLGVAHPDHKPRFASESKRIVEKLNNDYAYSKIEYLNQEKMAEISGSTQYFGGTFDQGAAHLHPLNYALGLAKAAQSLGVKIFEHTKVSHYKIAEMGQVFTAHGKVCTHKIVLACNGHLANLEPKLAGQIMPINNFIVATEPLDDALVEKINPHDVALADSRFVVNYYRLSADKRLLFGGGENYRTSFPKDIASFVRKPMLEIYPYLKDTKIDYAWGGTLAVTLNRMPNFGTLHDHKIIYAQGYSGHGVAMATLAGQMIADYICGDGDQFNIMANLPSPRFPGGKWLRWPSMVAGMAYYALRDRI